VVSDGHTLEQIYKAIVAGIGFAVLLTFSIYAVIVLKTYTQFHDVNEASTQRMFFLALICSIASTIQLIFLLLFAYTSIENVISVLVYLFVVEVIPLYVLLAIFFSPSRLEENFATLTTATASSAARSFPSFLRKSSKHSRESERNSSSTNMALSALASAREDLNDV